MASRPREVFCRCAGGILAVVGIILAPAPVGQGGQARGAGCYSGYGYSYSAPYYAPTYYYPTSYYKTIVREKVYVPISIFGSVYDGPSSVAAYLNGSSVGFARNTTGVAAAAAPAPAPAAAAVTKDDFARLTRIVEAGFGSLRTEVSSLRNDVNTTRVRMDAMEQRQRMVEARLNLPAQPGPGSGPPAAAPGAAAAGTPPPQPKPGDAPGPVERREAALPDALTVAKNKCALCHQEGSKSEDPDVQRQIVKGLSKFIMLTRDGQRAPLSAEASLAFNDVMLAGSMPPPAFAKKHPKYTMEQAEGEALVRARPSWPRKMEEAKE